MTAAAAPIAVYGGSFDPPHVAHVMATLWVLATTDVEKVLVVPTFQHPLDKRSHAEFDDRVRMCELAFADVRRVEISRIEEELGGPSRTLHTLEELKRRMPDRELRLLLGTDLLPETPRWHRFDRVAELAPPIMVGRAGHESPPGVVVELPDISSTDVRERLVRGEDVTGLVPRAVIAYAAERGLYRGERA